MNIAHAGVIANAPTLSEIILNFIKMFLSFAGGLTVLLVIISGILYMTSVGDSNRSEFAKKALIGSIFGLLFVILSFVIIKVIAKTLVS